MLVEDMSRNKCFFQVWISHVLRFISICDLFTDFFFLIGIVEGGVQLGPLGTAATNRPIVPALSDYDDGEIGGMIDRGNLSTRRKPAPVPLCPAQTPDAARMRTWAAMVGSQRLTAWATARPFYWLFLVGKTASHAESTCRGKSVPWYSYQISSLYKIKLAM
jgi:hypothetical protein